MKLQITTFGLIFFLSFNAKAVPESKVLSKFSSMFSHSWADGRDHLGEGCVIPSGGKNIDGVTYKICDHKTRNGLSKSSPDAKIRYIKFFSQNGDGKASKGSVVIAPGRAESSLKYIEVAYDLIKRGYSPVYSIDHRSQGLSSRFDKNPQKMTASSFKNYVNDFKDIVNKVIMTDEAVNKENLFLISNSMGGAITALYLQENQNHPFKASAMFGAMHKIEFPKPYTEFIANLISNLVCAVGKVGRFDCDDYAPGRGGDFNEMDRIFNENPLTHSRARYEMRNELWRARPYLAVGGVTYKWIKSATDVGRKMRRNAGKINIPLLLVTAEDDPIVDPNGHITFCQKAKKCLRHIATSSRHEILMEKDSIRNRWLGRDGILFKFFENPETYIKK